MAQAVCPESYFLMAQICPMSWRRAQSIILRKFDGGTLILYADGWGVAAADGALVADDTGPTLPTIHARYAGWECISVCPGPSHMQTPLPRTSGRHTRDPCHPSRQLYTCEPLATHSNGNRTSARPTNYRPTLQQPGLGRIEGQGHSEIGKT